MAEYRRLNSLRERFGLEGACIADYPRYRDTVETLYRSMRKMLRTAIACRVDVERFPESSLLPHRKEGEPCPRCEGTISKKTISGRSRYFCEGHQTAP